jgi:ADP-ribose pyrophosphatase YjhB (NUDIX family)
MALPTNAKKVFEGVMFSLYQWDQEQFDGSFKVFEAVVRKPSVQMIAIYEDKIVLLEEEQPFIGKFSALPGGVCESSNPEDDARRELEEETGLTSNNVLLWKKTDFSSKVVWNTFYFIMKGCVMTSSPHLDSGEKISVFYLSFEEFIERVLSKDFRNKQFANIVLLMLYQNKLDDFKKLLLG